MARVVHDLAEAVDPGLAAWIESSVSTVTTMVDRITPRTTPDDSRAVQEATGRADLAPGRDRAVPRVGAQRRLPRRPAAVGGCRRDLHRRHHSRSSTASCGCSTAATRCWPTPGRSAGTGPSPTPWPTTPAGPGCSSGGRRPRRTSTFRPTTSPPTGPRCSSGSPTRGSAHQLAQIAADGSQKLPVRILPTLRRERAAGRMPPGAVRVLAAWAVHPARAGAPVNDPRADEIVPLADGPLPDAARRVLGALDPAVAGDDERRRRRGRRRRGTRQRHDRAVPSAGKGRSSGSTSERPRPRQSRSASAPAGGTSASGSIRCSNRSRDGRCRTPPSSSPRSSTALSECVGRRRRRGDGRPVGEHGNARTHRARRLDATAHSPSHLGGRPVPGRGARAAQVGCRHGSAADQWHAGPPHDAADQAHVVLPARAGNLCARFGGGSA